MKMKKRALAILLALAMTLTLMPTVAFAGEKSNEKIRSKTKSVKQLHVRNEGNKRAKLGDVSIKNSEDWDLEYDLRYLTWEDDYLYAWVEYYDEIIPLEYNIFNLKDNTALFEKWQPLVKDDEDEYCVYYDSRDFDLGDYKLVVREVDNTNVEKSIEYNIITYWRSTIDGLYYELNGADEVNDLAGVWGYDSDNPPTGNITVLPQVKLSNGKIYLVTEVNDLYGLKDVNSISIPASVTYIEPQSIGYFGNEYDEEDGIYYPTYQKVLNFTVYGKTGSAAHQYAKNNGFAFRDLEAEAAAQAAAAQAAAAQARTATITAASNINKGTVTAADIQKASSLGATTVTLGPKVKKIKKNSFKGTGITTIVVKTKKLKKGSVKGSLKGSKVSTVKVEIGSKKVNKKFVKKYKKFFTKKNAGKKVKVK